MDGNYYNAEETAEPYIYSVELKITAKGKFAIDILDGGSVLASGQQFEIEKRECHRMICSIFRGENK